MSSSESLMRTEGIVEAGDTMAELLRQMLVCHAQDRDVSDAIDKWREATIEFRVDEGGGR